MKIPMVASFALPLALMAGGITVASGARADVSTSPGGQSTTADTLLTRAATTLSSLKSLHADFEENDSYPGPYKDLAQHGTVALARPGRLRIDIKRYRRVSSSDPWTPSGNDAVSVSDGATYTYAFLHPHSTQVRHQALSPRALEGALKVAPTLAGFFADQGLVAFSDRTGPASLLPSAKWEGHTYQVVEYPVASEEQTWDARAYIGDDNLVHRLVYRADTPHGAIVKEWLLRNARLDADLPSETFAYTPPTDATPLSSSPRTPLLAAGVDAPDFTVTDSHGKPVRLADYRGKTVILDFWATWCWPCNQSLPHINSVTHANRDKGVVTLAVAIWDSQTGFDTWIGKHNYPDIHFAIDPSPQGKDVASALYHVNATPTAYIIGPDGKIVTSITGYSGPTNELEAAVESAAAVKTANAGR